MQRSTNVAGKLRVKRAKPKSKRSITAARAKTDHEQLQALEATARREISLPAEACLIGERALVEATHYGGHPRAGLMASCSRNGAVYRVGLSGIDFPVGSEGERFASTYRAWLGLSDVSSVLKRSTAPTKPRKAVGDDIEIGAPLDLVVLACDRNAMRCRVLGSTREIMLRGDARDGVPGEIVTVHPTKRGTRSGNPYLAGTVQGSRSDVAALGLTPLEVRARGDWDPGRDYWGEDGERIEKWAKRIIARGKRPMVELEQVVPGADPDDFESDPIGEASELHAAGARAEARELLMELLAKDLRCLDAHAHLGNLEFSRRPRQAIRHYEVGVSIGAFALGKTFDGVLAWGLFDNRPFLRCMHGLGLCAWRLGNTREAKAIFTKMLWLNPLDNQGARFNLAAIEAGRTWEENEGVDA